MLSNATVIGTGLVGTSVALGLRQAGVPVRLEDRSGGALRQATRMGAGVPLSDGDEPADLVLLAVPPASVAQVLLRAQRRGLGRFYTDVASAKAAVIAAAAGQGCDFTTFVPGHPMAGAEHRGPSRARGDLFAGRSWALCPAPGTDPDAVATVRQAVRLLGAVPCELDAHAHDRAAALVSHAPHVVSSVLAARLKEADPLALRLAGRGLRDVTRVAAGDVPLWTDILVHNALPLAEVVEGLAADLQLVAEELRVTAADGLGGRPPALASLLHAGNAGRARLMGQDAEQAVSE
jgi:prephenate dehydrogenase